MAHLVIASLRKVYTFFRPKRQSAVSEQLVARYLKSEGYRVLGCNLRNRFGEVDILAEAPDRRTIVVVEVKSRTGQPDRGLSAVRPEVRVGYRKQRQLVALACQMARRYKLIERPIRFDVVGVDLPQGAAAVIRHHVGAFESHV